MLRDGSKRWTRSSFRTSNTTDNVIQNVSTDAAEHPNDVLAAGETSIAGTDKLIEQLQAARDFLQAEGGRVRQMNARCAHLAQTASASVGILAERLGQMAEHRDGCSCLIERRSRQVPLLSRSRYSPLTPPSAPSAPAPTLPLPPTARPIRRSG